MEFCSVLNPPICWEDVVFFWATAVEGTTMKAYLCKLVFESTTYNIWRNRNGSRTAPGLRRTVVPPKFLKTPKNFKNP